MAVETLHCRVQIKDPWQTQGWADGVDDVALHPAQTAGFIHALEGCAHHIFADDLVHAEKRGVDSVAAHRVDVSIAPVPAEDAQHDSAHDVEFATASITAVAQRTISEQLAPTRTRFEKLKEEHELALASNRSLSIPLGIKATSRRINGPPIRRLKSNRLVLTF